ncbi:MAG: outer membrane protein transport protein [Desulfamplus sp.]|nr:outer membrane protein transport protein [Desulfamplus sp.]
MKKIFYFLSAVLFIFLSSSTLYASGFGIFSQGASSFGQAGSSIAHSQSPSSVFYNPALINDLNGTQLELGTTIIKLKFEYEDDLTGASSTTDDSLFFPTTLYASHQFNSDISFGFGIFSPFGLSTEWGNSWEGRYIATNSELNSICINPAISYKVTPKITLAAGIDFIYLDASLENSINFTPYGLNDGYQKFSGDGSDYGFNLGMLYKFTESFSLGCSYRSGYSVQLDGDVSFDLPQESPDMMRALLPDTDAEAVLKLPEVFFAGVAFHITDKWTLETGILWEGWSDFRKIRTEFAQPVNGMTSNTVEKLWEDTVTTNIGIEYLYNDRLTLRTGYLYRENAIPEATFEPSLPDADAHLFALGFDVHWQRYTLSTAYVYERQKEREKNNMVGVEYSGDANGIYNSDIHFIALSLNLHF